MKKQKDLIFKITKEQFAKLQNDADFTAMVEVGRMLNAFELVMEKVRDLAADRDLPGYTFRQPNAVLGRLVNQSALLISRYEEIYKDAPHFQHLTEMFTGSERNIDPKPVHKLVLPEFRVISDDPETATALRGLDILGHAVVLDQTRTCPVIDGFMVKDERRPQPGVYRITRPKDDIERQVLSVLAGFVQDYVQGAEVFLNGCVTKLGLGHPGGKGRRVLAGP